MRSRQTHAPRSHANSRESRSRAPAQSKSPLASTRVACAPERCAFGRSARWLLQAGHRGG
eukprot:508178-Prorocentrum_minimum.AAC.1